MAVKQQFQSFEALLAGAETPVLVDFGAHDRLHEHGEQRPVSGGVVHRDDRRGADVYAHR